MALRIDHIFHETILQELSADNLRIMTDFLFEPDQSGNASIKFELLLPLIFFGALGNHFLSQRLWINLFSLLDRFGCRRLSVHWRLRAGRLDAWPQLVIAQVSGLLNLSRINPLPLEVILTLVELFG